MTSLIESLLCTRLQHYRRFVIVGAGKTEDRDLQYVVHRSMFYKKRRKIETTSQFPSIFVVVIVVSIMSMHHCFFK